MRSVPLFVVLLASGASAATIDFDQFPAGQTAGALDFAGVVNVSSSTGSLFVYNSGNFGMPAQGGVCGLTSVFTCLGTLSFSFAQPVEQVSFGAYFVGAGDASSVSAYAGTTLLGQLSVNAGGQYGFGALSGITNLVFADLGSLSGGVAYGGFTYVNVPPPPPPPPPAVPLPGALGLQASAVALGAFLLRRRRGPEK